jgi:hypothetical protein
MPRTTWTRHRTPVAVWAVLCAASLAATVVLNTSPAPGPRQPKEPEEPLSTECAAFVAELEKQLAEAREGGREGDVLLFVRTRVGAEDCHDVLPSHLAGGRRP